MKTISMQAEKEEFFACHFDEKISEIVEALLPHKKLIVLAVTK